MAAYAAARRLHCFAMGKRNLCEAMFCVGRLMSQSAAPVLTRTKIGKFELCSTRPAGVTYNPHPPPLAILIGWLNARRHHLEKYADLYLSRGFDVLYMDMSPVHIVRPLQGIKYVKHLHSVLQESENISTRQILVHGFSVGAFVYTQFLLQLQKADAPPHAVSPRLAAAVMDSPAYMDHMVRGIADSASSIQAVRSFVFFTLHSYLSLFPKSVTFHYRESHRIFHDNTVPTLMLFSSADRISSAEVTEDYLREWKEKGQRVFYRKWDDSPHVGHFRLHPEQYTEALFSFLDQIDLKYPH